ncbi:MAG: hypothetical protein Q8N69_03655, partial [bacterium]|nr:hypothetical protein [bacterium]
ILKDGWNHVFGEDGMLYRGKNGNVLYGKAIWCGEAAYWTDLGSHSDKTCKDPYEFIDGGFEPGGYYEYTNALPWKYTALTLILMPSLKIAWNNDQIISFADRWVTHGALTQPDPCAPVSQGGGSAGNGQCKLDPDLVPGSTFTNFSCIAGRQCGRFSDLDGANMNGGNRSSGFGEAMWAAYR